MLYTIKSLRIPLDDIAIATTHLSLAEADPHNKDAAAFALPQRVCNIWACGAPTT